MSATSDAWPIFTPTSQSKPSDAILSRIARHGAYNVANAAELPTLLAAIAAAGLPAPSTTMPVTAYLVAERATVRTVADSAWVYVSNAPWTSYTPTFTNLTLGNGSVSARHRALDKVLDVLIDITWGSTSAITSGNPYAFLPVRSEGVSVGASLGSAHLYDTSAGTYYVLMTSASGDANVRIASHGAGLSGTSPVTLAAGDIISIRLRYPIA